MKTNQPNPVEEQVTRAGEGWYLPWDFRKLSFHRHSASKAIAAPRATFKKETYTTSALLHAFPLGKDGMNPVLQMSVMFCDVLAIERRSAAMGIKMLRKC